mmetsp:Transcript_30583/g.58936  ORF Transcript_30583/g.58936 Transcript_30583/m.58936 type:complete len:223 (+) Transcript_30583:1219-1887(+)
MGVAVKSVEAKVNTIQPPNTTVRHAHVSALSPRLFRVLHAMIRITKVQCFFSMSSHGPGLGNLDASPALRAMINRIVLRPREKKNSPTAPITTFPEVAMNTSTLAANGPTHGLTMSPKMRPRTIACKYPLLHTPAVAPSLSYTELSLLSQLWGRAMLKPPNNEIARSTNTTTNTTTTQSRARIAPRSRPPFPPASELVVRTVTLPLAALLVHDASGERPGGG